MDFDGLAVGLFAGFIVGGLIFTATGREVSRAVGSRAAHHIRPKTKSKRR